MLSGRTVGGDERRLQFGARQPAPGSPFPGPRVHSGEPHEVRVT